MGSGRQERQDKRIGENFRENMRRVGFSRCAGGGSFEKHETYNGSVLQFHRVERRQMGAYLCIASNDVPPAVSKRVTLAVNCKLAFLLIPDSTRRKSSRQKAKQLGVTPLANRSRNCLSFFLAGYQIIKVKAKENGTGEKIFLPRFLKNLLANKFR